jgi:hypothetical protein
MKDEVVVERRQCNQEYEIQRGKRKKGKGKKLEKRKIERQMKRAMQS